MHEMIKKHIADGTAKNILISLIVIGIFVSVIFFYYNMLYTEKRQGIIRNGQVIAQQSADQLQDYLATSINAINLTSYTLSTMIRNEQSTERILDYLVGQSSAVTGSIFASSTGIYAYVNDTYVDGSLWVPAPDYVATQRPWYVQTMANGGRLTIVDPYIDAQTGNVMTTIAKGLPDGKSIVAMDIALDQIQKIAEEAVSSGGTDYEVILDSRSMVVSHSDRGEIGKKYAEEKDTFWGMILNKANKVNSGFFELEYDGEDYIIYIVNIRDNWRCLSVKNATAVYRPLRQLLALTVGVIILVVLILSYIMNRTNRQYQVAEKLNKQLSSISNIYVSMYDIDIDEDSFTEIKSASAYLSILAKKKENSAWAMIKTLMRKVAEKESRKDLLHFLSMDTLKDRLRNTETISTEFAARTGQWVRVRFIVSQRQEDGTPVRVLLLAEDIDKEKRARDELIGISERAIAANKAKSSFLSNMSHEIRTPINAVLGMNEMILRECQDSNILAYSGNIKTAGNTLLGLINDILDFSKIEAGKLELLIEEYDLSSVINDLVNMVQSRADDKGLAVSLNYDETMPKRLFGDEVRIKQVIMNLLTNAVKYTNHGGITFSINYDRVAEEDSVLLRVAVRDTGIGIKPEDMDKLFQKFERIEEKRNRSIEGTGLGLAISQSLLEMMGTTLQVESVYGRGSKFFFTLKQKVAQWEPLGDYQVAYNTHLQSRQAYHEKFTAPDALVLVVDDNPMNLMVFKSLLKQTRIAIDTADSGDEGLALSWNRKYDVIFLDMMMPRKDGLETLQELRGHKGGPNFRTPTICLTANAVSGAREQYITAGFDDYLTKPVDANKLEEMLLHYLPPAKIQEAAETDESTAPAGTEALPEMLLPLKEQDWIDLSTGIRNSGSVDAFLPLLRIFYESLDDKADEIEGFYQTGNISDYTIKVHALKSSARLIGATAFGEEAQLLENAGKSDDLDYIRSHHDDFMKKCRSFKEPLAEVFAEKEDEDKPEADADFLRDAYDEIREAAASMDSDLLDSILGEMKRYRIPAQEQARWKQVLEAADRFDFEAIGTLLAKPGE